MTHAAPHRPRRLRNALSSLLVVLTTAAAAHYVTAASGVEDRTATLQVSPVDYLDVFYDEVQALDSIDIEIPDA